MSNQRETPECPNCLYQPSGAKTKKDEDKAPAQAYFKPDTPASDGDCPQCHYPPAAEETPEDCPQCHYTPDKK